MSNDTEGFGVGFAACGFFLLIIFMAGMLGWIVAAQWVSSDCRDFGKTQIKGTWYECRKLEEKK